MSISNKLHWKKIYETKTPDQVSWTQVIPEISLKFIHSIGLSKNASIINMVVVINHVDHLLDMGFINILIGNWNVHFELIFIPMFGVCCLLFLWCIGHFALYFYDLKFGQTYFRWVYHDIRYFFNSYRKSKKRLGSRAEKINWIVSDINEYVPHSIFDLWHDRAAFHFLTKELEIKKYLDTVNKYVNGYLILGTFSENGPQKCSGLDIKNYTTEQLSKCLFEAFTTIQCKTVIMWHLSAQLKIFLFAALST